MMPSSRAAAIAVPLAAMGLLAVALVLVTMPAGSRAPVRDPAPRGVDTAAAAKADPLPSWNESPAKRAILDFVRAVTREGAATFVPVADRVAVFDHDGTLVCEKPIVHGMFLIDRIRALAERRPEIAHEEPYATLLTGDIDFIRRLGKRFFADLTFSALAGVPEEKLEAAASEFVRTARHPVFDVRLGETTFQPMHELMALLRANGFSVWICSGSGVHFMRPAAEAWYGIGPEHVIASRPATEMREIDDVELREGESPNRRLDLVVLPSLEVLNDEARKPVSIGERIGRRPIFAAGNVGTGGDIDMLRWSQSGDRPNLQLLVLHDDAEREMAYGEPTNASLDAAARYGWHVVRMASDWNRVFARPLAKLRTTPAGSPVPEPSPKPVDAPAAAPTGGRWEKELAAFATAERESPPRPGGVCLLGSSNIRMWDTLAEDFPGIDMVNRGVGGCRLDELAEFGPRLAAAVKPRLVVISAGGNDVAAGRTTEQVLAAFEASVAGLRTAVPDVPIVFLAMNPSIKRWEQFERQKDANAAVRTFIESGRGGDGLHFIDITAAFLGQDGEPDPACFIDDLLHPSPVGNARRAAIMRPVIDRLLAPAER